MLSRSLLLRFTFPHAASALGLIAAAATSAFAQSAPVPRPAEMAPDVVELSPFVITSSEEKGYVATSSLAGSRMKTELKDIASQIDVLTPEFLADIGARNIADAVVYSSNFGATFDQNIGPNDGVAVGSSRTEGRARGMDQATVSSDFFATNLPTDFYNVERLNLAYGAQSILFGLGNAGGVLDTATKRAQLRNFGSVELRADTWDSRRGILDVNRQLFPRRLALRFVGLDSDDRQFTDGGKNRQKRAFGAVTFQPFKSTVVRASYERVNQTLRLATNYVSYDFVTPWVAAGRPTFDNSTGNAAIATNNPLFSRNTNALRTITYDRGSLLVTPWNGTALTLGPHQVPGIVDPRRSSLLDNRIYPTDTDPRVLTRQNDVDGHIVRAFVEHRFTPDFHVELGFNLERRDERGGGTFDNGESIEIRADANRFLPGGTAARPQTTPNPNVGRLYIESFPHGARAFDETREVRLTGAYEFDAARKLGRGFGWLGRHRFALLASQRQDISRSQEDRAMIVGDTSFTTGDKLNNSRLLRARHYLDSAGGGRQAGPVAGSGVFGPWTLTEGATSYQVALFDNPEGHFYVPVGAKLKDDTQMLGWQSYLLKDRVVGFLGLRRDDVRTFALRPQDLERGDYRTPGDHAGLYRSFEATQFESTPDAKAKTLMQTYGIVVHPLRWVSLFYNKSENTSLPPGKLGPFGNQLPGVSSHGYDWGARFSLLQDRVSLRVNVFQDSQTDFWSNPFQGLRDMGAVIENRLRGDDRPPGIGAVAASTFDPVGNPVSLYRSVSAKTTEGLDAVLVANLTAQWDLRLTVGRQNNIVDSRSKEWIDWIAQRLPVWQSAGGLGWNRIAVASNDSRTIEQYYNQAIVPEIASLQLATGTQRFRQREWRANLFTNYRFEDGWRKGLSVGGGVRWWGPGNTGNGGQLVPGIAAPVVDTRVLHRGAKSQTFVDAVIAYRRPFMFGQRKLGWRVQLNVRNLFDYDELEVARSDYAGAPFEFLRVAPRQVSLSTTLSF